MATRAPLMTPANETDHSVSRITREGKKLTYKLSVMQQPERARACGAGAKSSADRRPVDPPPVVELRIFESDPDDMHKTDITFAYNANFFLFATLELHRPIAPGRMPGGAIPTCPVLTGVPVAGIAYLDRPSQAGYFIFPDLSVRHEGRYRLNFHLYEEIKDPKDADKDAPMQNPLSRSPMGKPGAPQSSLNFRLEVKSQPFTVFSAKKFPGLTTSTSLSRIIAEQGCRVRIRRDVRMRRRGDKRTEDYEYDEERVYPRSTDRYATPDAHVATPFERPRSTSASTIEPQLPYGPDAQRRPSATDYGFPAPQPYQRPMPPAAPVPAPPTPSQYTPAYPSHLSFGSAQPHYQAPPLPPTPQAANTPTYSPHIAAAHTRSSSMASEYEPAPTGYPYSKFRPAERTGYPERPSYPSKAGTLPPILSLQPPKLPIERRPSNPTEYPSMAARVPTPSNMVPSLPPIKDLSPGYLSNTLPRPPNNLQSPNHDARARRFYETGPTLSKRSHDETFGADERPLHNGMRPDTESYPTIDSKVAAIRREIDAEVGEDGKFAYKRANGRVCLKDLPAFQ